MGKSFLGRTGNGTRALFGVSLIVGASICLALVAGSARAIPADYFDLEGDVRGDRQASVGIRFERRDGERMIAPFRADYLRMECRGGAIQRSGSLNFGLTSGIQIQGRDRTFSKRAGDAANGGRVTGRLLDGGEARGTVEWHADQVFGLRNCDTGELNWHAERRVP